MCGKAIGLFSAKQFYVISKNTAAHILTPCSLSFLREDFSSLACLSNKGDMGNYSYTTQMAFLLSTVAKNLYQSWWARLRCANQWGLKFQRCHTKKTFVFCLINSYASWWLSGEAALQQWFSTQALSTQVLGCLCPEMIYLTKTYSPLPRAGHITSPHCKGTGVEWEGEQVEIQSAINVSARDVPANNQCNGKIPLSECKTI